jgi:hypothetical protein
MTFTEELLSVDKIKLEKKTKPTKVRSEETDLIAVSHLGELVTHHHHQQPNHHAQRKAVERERDGIDPSNHARRHKSIAQEHAAANGYQKRIRDKKKTKQYCTIRNATEQQSRAQLKRASK